MLLVSLGAVFDGVQSGFAVKMTLTCEEMASGDRHDVDNPFHWAAIWLNLPGTRDYTYSYEALDVRDAQGWQGGC